MIFRQPSRSCALPLKFAGADARSNWQMKLASFARSLSPALEAEATTAGPDGLRPVGAYRVPAACRTISTTRSRRKATVADPRIHSLILRLPEPDAASAASEVVPATAAVQALT
jgi:hypothetical protein